VGLFLVIVLAGHLLLRTHVCLHSAAGCANTTRSCSPWCLLSLSRDPIQLRGSWLTGPAPDEFPSASMFLSSYFYLQSFMRYLLGLSWGFQFSMQVMCSLNSLNIPVYLFKVFFRYFSWRLLMLCYLLHFLNASFLCAFWNFRMKPCSEWKMMYAVYLLLFLRSCRCHTPISELLTLIPVSCWKCRTCEERQSRLGDSRGRAPPDPAHVWLQMLRSSRADGQGDGPAP
jgi:hypothetical protein